MNENNIKKPQPKPISKGVANTLCLTQFTSTTGAVWRLVTTARVAPVSLTLLVKTIIAPESMEYFVNGKIIVLKTPKGLAPSVLDASSKSKLILSTAADIDLTKYGYVIARWAKINNHISGMKAKFSFQKIASETPKAIDGTISGMLTSTSNIADGKVPNFLLATIIAIGKPIITFKTVTTAPRKYERMRLCQYSPQTPTPDSDLGKVSVKMALNAGSATKRDGISITAKKIKSVMLFLEVDAFE